MLDFWQFRENYTTVIDIYLTGHFTVYGHKKREIFCASETWIDVIETRYSGNFTHLLISFRENWQGFFKYYYENTILN